MQSTESRTRKLAVLGPGLFGEEVFDLVEEIDSLEVGAFIESENIEKTNEPLLGRPVIWIEDAAALMSTHDAIGAIGTTQRQGPIEQLTAMGFGFATIIHPSVRLSRTSSVAEGSILSVGVIVAAQVAVGRHVIINRGSLIGHHSTVHDFVTISPGVNIAGSVTIGEGTYVGMGAIVLDGRTVGADSVIGAGAVVTDDVPDNVQVMGIPARITKEGAGRL